MVTKNGSESVGWQLLGEIGRAMGVSLEKVSPPPEVNLQPEFARIVKPPEGMTAVEMATGFDLLHSMTRLSRDALRCARSCRPPWCWCWRLHNSCEPTAPSTAAAVAAAD